ncbi:MAG: flagellar biosynthesis protein FlhB [Firmicutes bacterium]|nr:flagellar biosynthesis protein FlhB [Bacillota bacterium]
MSKEAKDKKRPGRRLAAALRYRPAIDSAPRVLASGKGIIADNIIALAREHGLPIQKDSSLVDVLCRIELGKEIPPELYEAVARILSFLVYVDGLKEGKMEK